MGRMMKYLFSSMRSPVYQKSYQEYCSDTDEQSREPGGKGGDVNEERSDGIRQHLKKGDDTLDQRGNETDKCGKGF